MVTTRRWWVSWCDPSIDTFEWHGPWWESGRSVDDVAIVCAAVVAPTITAAMDRIRQAHDDPKVVLIWRFCEPNPDDWQPFSDRFKRAPWMKWPHGDGRRGEDP